MHGISFLLYAESLRGSQFLDLWRFDFVVADGAVDVGKVSFGQPRLSFQVLGHGFASVV